MTINHSRTGASSMYRWENCPGSVRLCEGKEQIESEYAKEGTRAHKAAEVFLNTGQWPEDASTEMKKHLAQYVEYVKKLPGKTLIEQTLMPFEEDSTVYGTVDAVNIHDGTLEIIDLKYGEHTVVEATENEQLLFYAFSAYKTIKALGENEISDIFVTIIQPRAYHPQGPVRSWYCTPDKLVSFGHRLKKAIAETRKSYAPLKAGSWCRFCPAAGECPALYSQALTIAAQEFNPLYTDISTALDTIPLVDTWIKAVKQYAHNEAVNGRVAKGYKLVNAKTTRDWSYGPLETLTEKLGLEADDLFEPRIISPARAEKLFPEKKKQINELCTRLDKGVVLVPLSDRRKEVKLGPDADFVAIPTNQS